MVKLLKKAVSVLIISTVISINLFPGQTVNASVAIPSVSAGAQHSLALKSDGTVWAWGDNSSGQLGDDSYTDQILPKQVQNLDNIIKIAAGAKHSVALKSDGTVWAWGNNQYGQLGDGTKVGKKTPVQVGGLTGVIDIAANEGNSFAVKNDGLAWVWGASSNKAGNGSKAASTVPVRVHNATNIVKVTTGDSNTSAVTNDGTVWMWGSNQFGSIGDGTTTIRDLPVMINFSSAMMVAPASGQSLGLKTDGTVWNWGSWQTGGIYPSTQSKTPRQVPNLNNVIFIDSEQSNALAIKNDGTLWSWGYNGGLDLGTGYSTSVPQRDYIPRQVVLSDLLTPLIDVNYASIGSNHTLVIKNDGTVWSWGGNSNGQLGDGTLQRRLHAVEVIGLKLIDQQQIVIGDVKYVHLAQGASQKYTFIPQTTGLVNFTTGFHLSPSDTVLHLFDENNVLLATNDDFDNTAYSRITFNVIAGQKYTIEASGYQNSAANFTLTLQ